MDTFAPGKQPPCQRRLEDEGLLVASTSGSATLDKALMWMPDLLLLDLWMPGMDGQAICVQLKQQATIKHLPITMLSANHSAGSIAQAAGADGYLAKPF